MKLEKGDYQFILGIVVSLMTLAVMYYSLRSLLREEKRLTEETDKVSATTETTT